MITKTFTIMIIVIGAHAHAADYPLKSVIIDNESSEIITSCGSSSAPESSEALAVLKQKKCYIETLPADPLKKILEYTMVADPKNAGNLIVCKVWNQYVNDRDLTLRVIAHKPNYYALHLATAMCKELNSQNEINNSMSEESSADNEQNYNHANANLYPNMVCRSTLNTCIVQAFLGGLTGLAAGGTAYALTGLLPTIILIPIGCFIITPCVVCGVRKIDACVKKRD